MKCWSLFAFQGVHNKLQGEKNRLSLAVQACEAATASLSRPTSPQEAIMQPIPDKELLVRARLEDLIDQVCFRCMMMILFAHQNIFYFAKFFSSVLLTVFVLFFCD